MLVDPKLGNLEYTSAAVVVVVVSVAPLVVVLVIGMVGKVVKPVIRMITCRMSSASGSCSCARGCLRFALFQHIQLDSGRRFYVESMWRSEVLSPSGHRSCAGYGCSLRLPVQLQNLAERLSLTTPSAASHGFGSACS